MDFPTFTVPCTIFIAGCSQSGKTNLVLKILRNPECIFNKGFDQKYLYFMVYQPTYEHFKNFNVILKTGKPKFEEIKENSLVILDDLQTELAKSQEFLDLITTYVHHRKISVLFLTQNLFLKGLRDSRVNAQGIILMKSPSDQLIIQNLAKQLFPKRNRFFMKSYAEATAKPYSYLIIDLSLQTREDVRLRSRVLPSEWPPAIHIENPSDSTIVYK